MTESPSEPARAPHTALPLPLAQDVDAIQWQSVSPRYMKLRVIQRIIWTVVLMGLSLIPWAGVAWWGWVLPLWLVIALPTIMLVWQITLFILTPRQIRSWGYAEFENHLVVTRGLLTRTTTSVPYGRIQLVDVKSGPIESALKLSRVELQTASVGTNAVICGIEQDEATRLREVLTVRGEESMVKM